MSGGAREVGRDRFARGGRSDGRLESAWHEVTEKGRRGRIGWRVLAREEGDRAHVALLPAYGPVLRVPRSLRGAGRVGRLRARGLRSVGQRTEELYNAFFSDYLFVIICAFLGVNAISRDYTLSWQVTYSSRLLFLRSLPVPA